MGCGTNVFVGKSRLRKKYRLKRQETKQARIERRRSSTSSASPTLSHSNMAYDALPSDDDSAEVFAELPVESACVVGSVCAVQTVPRIESGLALGSGCEYTAHEETAPLISLYPEYAAPLKKQQTRLGAFAKVMPFGPFKALQEKREAEERAKKEAEEAEQKRIQEEEEAVVRAEEERVAEEKRQEEEKQKSSKVQGNWTALASSASMLLETEKREAEEKKKAEAMQNGDNIHLSDDKAALKDSVDKSSIHDDGQTKPMLCCTMM